ncbi:MAG: hypothetical protein Alpg2KO_07590 [Alphaproteobacteria bacterium]
MPKPIKTALATLAVALTTIGTSAQAQSPQLTQEEITSVREVVGVLTHVSHFMQQKYSGKPLPGAQDGGLSGADMLAEMKSAGVIPSDWTLTDDKSGLKLTTGPVITFSSAAEGESWSATVDAASAGRCHATVGQISTAPGRPYFIASINGQELSFPTTPDAANRACSASQQALTFTRNHDLNEIPLSAAAQSTKSGVERIVTAVNTVFPASVGYIIPDMEPVLASRKAVGDDMLRRIGRRMEIIIPPSGPGVRVLATDRGKGYRINLKTISGQDCVDLTRSLFNADLLGLVGTSYGKMSASRSSTPQVTPDSDAAVLTEACEKGGRRPVMSLFFTKEAVMAGME